MIETLTLYDLNRHIRNTLEQGLSGEYWVQAELSEVRVAHNGHCYLELIQKDHLGVNLIAKARGQIWNSIFRLLKPYFERETGQTFSAGLKVLIRVAVTFHELYGYSLTVTDIDPVYTVGDMARRRKEILLQLEQEGILNDNKELRLSALLNRVAVISSATAAGYGDFCNQLLHNDYGFNFRVRLFPAVMQGEQVEASVLSALDCILEQRDSWDVVVLIRGGGATSDLACFDTYLLAASCAQFPLPIITGIGHERDDTVLDSVSHTRVKTPTAAAAFLIHRMLATAGELENVQRELIRAISGCMDRENLYFQQIVKKLPGLFQQTRHEQELRLEQLFLRIHNGAKQYVSKHRHKTTTVEQRLAHVLSTQLTQETHRLNMLEQHCASLNPERMLRLGYSMTLKEGKLIKSCSELESGDEIVTQLAQGEIRSVVK